MNRLALALLLQSLAPAASAASCQISATDLAFGQYRFNSPTDVLTTATISIDNCVDDGGDTNVSYSIAIGTGGSASFADRAMGGISGALHYNVYADASHTMVWGDGGGGSVDVSGGFTIPGVTSATHTAYARIPAGQTDLSPGQYADQLTITINY